MTQTTKDAIIAALKADLGNAADNLCRASRAFSELSPDQMNSQYGQSGQTRQQILDGYQEWHRKAKAALEEATEAL